MTQVMDFTHDHRVADGIDALQAYDAGWRNRVTEPVQMSSGATCVLGQVFGGYWTGASTLFGGHGFAASAIWAVEHGFNAQDYNDYDEEGNEVDYSEFTAEEMTARDYQALTEAWRRAEPTLTFLDHPYYDDED